MHLLFAVRQYKNTGNTNDYFVSEQQRLMQGHQLTDEAIRYPMVLFCLHSFGKQFFHYVIFPLYNVLSSCLFSLLVSLLFFFVCSFFYFSSFRFCLLSSRLGPYENRHMTLLFFSSVVVIHHTFSHSIAVATRENLHAQRQQFNSIGSRVQGLAGTYMYLFFGMGVSFSKTL